MRNQLVILFIVCTLCVWGHAATVSVEKAEIVAVNWMGERTGRAASRIVISEIDEYSCEEYLTAYVINLSPAAFVIVSADDTCLPVIGYSMENTFPKSLDSPSFKMFFEQKMDEIRYAITSQMEQPLKTREEWNRLAVNWDKFRPVKASKAVQPLLTTKWSQERYYNAYCPADASSCSICDGHVYVGCVAVAIGQIMRYHAYPVRGRFAWSYTPAEHPEYGEQSADFDNTTYNWSNMPNQLYTYNTDVARFLHHCGVAVEMDYGPHGSGAFSDDARTALILFFRYSAEAFLLFRDLYNYDVWEEMMKAELDASRPIYYGGTGTGGHAFVMDGYTVNNGLDWFHMNWGWGGSGDGWFLLSNLQVGSHNYSYNQNAIVNIMPDPSCEVALYSPSGVSNWQTDYQYYIIWDWLGGGCSSQVKLQLFKGGAFVRDIVASIDNYLFNYLWTVPSDLASGNDYRIKLTDLDSSTTAFSDYFTITGMSNCSVQVTAPGSGETWYRSYPYDITWNSGGGSCGNSMRIQLYKNGGYYSQIASSTANDGSYEWTVPASLPEGSDYQIRIIDLASSADDYSDGLFTIAAAPACSVTVISPNGGEQCYCGRSYDLTWGTTGNGCSSYVQINLYKQDVYYQNIVYSTPNDGSYNWTIPGTIPPGTDYKIKVIDVWTAAMDTSDATFTIKAAGDANFSVGGYLGVGTENPQRAVHIQGANAVFRMDRDRNSASFILARTDSTFNEVLKAYTVGVDAWGANQGQFIINDLGTAVAGGGSRRMTINTDGHVTFEGSVMAAGYFSPSSLRFKTDIRQLTDALDRLLRLRGIRFDWLKTGRASLGFIAEEVFPILPEMVKSDQHGGIQALSYDAVIPLLVESVRAQQSEIHRLKMKRDRLEALLDELTRLKVEAVSAGHPLRQSEEE